MTHNLLHIMSQTNIIGSAYIYYPFSLQERIKLFLENYFGVALNNRVTTVDFSENGVYLDQLQVIVNDIIDDYTNHNNAFIRTIYTQTENSCIQELDDLLKIWKQGLKYGNEMNYDTGCDFNQDQVIIHTEQCIKYCATCNKMINICGIPNSSIHSYVRDQHRYCKNHIIDIIHVPVDE